MKLKPDITIIVTALNEEKNVAHFLRSLRSTLQDHEINHEVIFVDDGSTDKTSQEVALFSDWNSLKHLQLTQNRGSGGAIKEGLKQATGEWYAWLPCDLEIMPNEILAPFRMRGTYDVVVTYFSSGQHARSLFRRFLSNLFTKILNLFFGQDLPYYNGLSLIRLSLINPASVRSNGFFFHAELLIRCLTKTQNIFVTPIHLTQRVAGKPKALRLKVFRDVILCFMKTWWELKLQQKKTRLPS